MPLNRLKLATSLRNQGIWVDDLQLVDAILTGGSPDELPTGEESSLKAVAINPGDHDAHASLGGQLKRAGQLRAACVAYQRASGASQSHAYPLLNMVKLEASLQGRFVVDARRRFQLQHAEKLRTAQANSSPPADAPWCFFDLAELRLYAKDRWNALRWMYTGVHTCSARWQAETCRQSLLLLTGIPEIDGSLLTELVQSLAQAQQVLPV